MFIWEVSDFASTQFLILFCNNSKVRIPNYLLFLKTAIIPAASAGGSCDGDSGRSDALCNDCNIDAETLPGVDGREEEELVIEGGYQDCVAIPWELGSDC